MMSESEILKECKLAATKCGARLFRNNCGVAVYQSGHRVKYGLCTGSSDLIGWTPRVIQPDDVGRLVAVFTAIETKQPGKRPTAAQQNFIERVLEAGGIAAVATNCEDVEQVLS